MDNVQNFRSEYPNAWQKIENDSTFVSQTNLVIDTDNNLQVSVSSGIEAISCYLGNIPICEPSDLVGKLRSFFHANKYKGRVCPTNENCSTYMAIDLDNYVKLAKNGLGNGGSGIALDPVFQDTWATEIVRDFTANKCVPAINSSWTEFALGTPLQWCFSSNEPNNIVNKPFSLNCRLKLKNGNENHSWMLIEFEPGEKKLPTFLDAGSNLYEFWEPGGKTVVHDGCNQTEPIEGLDEYVFRPSEFDNHKDAWNYQPCANVTW